MSTYTPKNYSKIQTLCNILIQYSQQTAYNYEQVDILESSLATLHAESLEAESIRQQLDSVRGLAAQTAAAEAATVIRLRAIVDLLIPLA
jgi:site-specific recombinase XerC